MEIPASFGLEGFEDATWEATEDLLGDCCIDGSSLSSSSSIPGGGKTVSSPMETMINDSDVSDDRCEASIDCSVRDWQY